MLFVFKKYQYEQTRGLLNSVQNSGDSILLPLPKNLIDRTSVRVNRAELGNRGELAATAASSGLSSIAAAQEAVKSILPSGSSAANAVTAILSGGGISSDLASQSNFLFRSALNKVGGGFAAGVDIGTGTTINPKAALAFEGVDLKMHTFDWDLAPKNPGESETIKNIINMIKRNMLPSYENLVIGGASALQRVFLRYPSLVEIYLIGVDENHFVQYKTGMIQSLDLNYSQTGQISLVRGGKPAIVGLQMSFNEADIHTSGDYGGIAETTIIEQSAGAAIRSDGGA